MTEYKKAIILILTFALGITGGYFLRLSGIGINEQRDVISLDTLIIEKFSEPIIIEKIKPEIIVRKDTVLRFYPFTAKADTVIRKDTIYMSYSFPENLFDLSIYPAPDSLRYVNTMLEVKAKDEAWWIKPAYFLGGLTVGALSAGITK